MGTGSLWEGEGPALVPGHPPTPQARGDGCPRPWRRAVWGGSVAAGADSWSGGRECREVCLWRWERRAKQGCILTPDSEALITQMKKYEIKGLALKIKLRLAPCSTSCKIKTTCLRNGLQEGSVEKTDLWASTSPNAGRGVPSGGAGAGGPHALGEDPRPCNGLPQCPASRQSWRELCLEPHGGGSPAGGDQAGVDLGQKPRRLPRVRRLGKPPESAQAPPGQTRPWPGSIWRRVPGVVDDSTHGVGLLTHLNQMHSSHDVLRDVSRMLIQPYFPS